MKFKMKIREKELLRDLLFSGLLDINNHVLSDGTYSPFKFLVRTPENGGKLTDEHIGRVGEALYDLATEKNLYWTSMAGIPDSGIPLSNAFFNAQPIEKQRETKKIRLVKNKENFVEPFILCPDKKECEGNYILIIDDVVTNAYNKSPVISKLKYLGAQVKDVLVCIDRQLEGVRVLEAYGTHVHYLWRANEALMFAGELGIKTGYTINKCLTHMRRFSPAEKMRI